jgi:predicted CopG family antitoxin
MKTKSPKVFIERAEPLTIEGIRAICMDDEDYEKYREEKDQEGSLSEKIILYYKDRKLGKPLLRVEDVRSTVKKLKELIENWNFKDDIIKSWTTCRINEIFGEELSNGK